MNHDITGDTCAEDGIGFAVRSKRRGAVLAANRCRDGIIIARSLVQGEDIIRGIVCRGRRRCVCRAGAGNRDGISLRSSVGANDQVSGDARHLEGAVAVVDDGNLAVAHSAAGKAVIIMRILLRSKGIIFAMAHSSCAGKPFGQGDGIVACHGDGDCRASAVGDEGEVVDHAALKLRGKGGLLPGRIGLCSKGNLGKAARLQRLALRGRVHGGKIHIAARCVRPDGGHRYSTTDNLALAGGDVKQACIKIKLVRYGDDIPDILVKGQRDGDCLARLDDGLVHAGGQIRRKCADAQAEHQDHSQKHR